MAVDQFIKLGDLEGESGDDSKKGWIDVLAWSWGMSQSGTTHMGGGSGAGKANVQDISITKWIDHSTPDIMSACLVGKHFPTANLVVRKAGETPLEYLKLDLKNVIVTSVSTGGSGGEDRLTENVTLNFEEVKFVYVEQTEKGKGNRKPEYTYNMKANKKV